MWFTVLLFIFGIILLSKFSEICIRSIEKFSSIAGISRMAVGFVLVGLATSIPEMAVMIISASGGEITLGLGNIIGANIADISITIGVISLISVIIITKRELEEIYRTIAITSVVAFFAIFLATLDKNLGLFCIIFYVFSIMAVMNKGIAEKSNHKDIAAPTAEILKVIFLTAVSITLVIISAQIIVNSAIEISRIYGIAESLIGISIIALGTTLPELAVNITAVRKKDYSLAIGNCIGSLITNITLVLGVGLLISTITPSIVHKLGFFFFIIVNALFLTLATRMKFDKISGIVLVGSYIMIMAVLFSV